MSIDFKDIQTAPALAQSENDIRLAVRHPDADVRATATTRLGRSVRNTALSDLDREKLRIILAHIAEDVASIVRRALAVTLRNSPELPHDVAVRLIKDLDSIAAPVLECSPVLTDEDLLDILRSKAAAKVLAIARRPSISGSIVRAVIRFGDSQAVAGLAANDRAPLDEAAYEDMLNLARSNDLIKESLISRRELPPAVIEKMLTFASEEIAIRLAKHHEIPPHLAIELADRTRERATIDFVEQSWVSRDLKLFVARLHEQGRLTQSLIIRAACCGQFRFLEEALAVRSGVSVVKAALMIHESGAFGLQALGFRAGLDKLSVHILRGATAIYKDLERCTLAYDRSYFQRLMIERALSLPAEFSEEDADYLLEKLDGLTDYSLEDYPA